MTTRNFVFGTLLTIGALTACGEEATTTNTEVRAGSEPAAITLTEQERLAQEKSARMAAEAEARAAEEKAEAEAAELAAAEAAMADEKAAEDDYRQTEAYKKASAERRRKRHEKRRLEREAREREAAAAPTQRPVEYAAPKPATGTTGRPKMQFAQTIHTFEPIEEGEKVTRVFKFTNTGTGPLEITNAEVSCGCTYPSYPFLPVAPGESGEVTVTFNSKGKFGKQKPIVTIYTNTPEKQFKLMLEGEVITEVAEKKVPEKG